MKTNANPGALPSGTAEVPAISRLSYPPPPAVGVSLSEPTARGLRRLGRLTGLTVGEVAAMLLGELVSGDSALGQFCAAAAGLQNLHAQRRQELGIKTLPPTWPESNPPGDPPFQAAPVRILLSARLNEHLYAWAIGSGMTRRAAARVLLQTTNFEALANEICRATNPALLGAVAG